MSQPEAGAPPDPAEQPQGSSRPQPPSQAHHPTNMYFPNPKPQPSYPGSQETCTQSGRGTIGELGGPKRGLWKNTSREARPATNKGEREVAKPGAFLMGEMENHHVPAVILLSQ